MSELTSMMVVSRSVVAGVCGGIVAAAFVGLVGQDSIDAAIGIEEATSDGDDIARFSRPVQVIGGLLAAVVYGIVTGIIFGTVFAAVRHRLPGATDYARSVLLASGAFVATALIPALKYPANPPAVGDPGTVGQRTINYLTLVAAAFVLLWAIGLLDRQLRSRFDPPSAISLTVVGGLAGVAFLLIVWPASPDTVPADFPAQLLWRFRLESLTTLALSWTTVGLVLGWLLTRQPRRVAERDRSV